MKATSLIRAILVLLSLAPEPLSAQTRSVRDTATTYGVRLNAKGQPANLNSNRINSRVDSRIPNRLALRIERYRPDSTENPAAAFQAVRDDKSRAALVIAPQPQHETP